MKLLDLQKRMAPKQIDLRKQLLEDKINLSKVKRLLSDTAKIHAEIRFNGIKQRVEFESVLTKAQKSKLQLEKRQHRRGHRRGGPRGY